jgi:hypothetical protein
MSSLASALPEFTNRSDFSKSPLTAGPSSEPPRRTNERNLIKRTRLWLGKVLPPAFARYLIAFFIGVAAILAWQSYGGVAREVIARWSPQLGWLAPPAAPVVQTAPTASAVASPDQLKATSLALAAVRQSVDKLATEISKLQVQGTPDRTSASPPSRSGSRRL